MGRLEKLARGPSPDRGSALEVLVDSEGCMPEWAVQCLSQLFSSLSDPTRLRIIYALVANRRLNVTELAASAGLSVSAVSHQLRILRDRSLVTAARDGRMVFYSLADDHVRTLFLTGAEHASEDCTNSLRREAERAG